MKNDHSSLKAQLKEIDMPLYESEAYLHSLQYYKTERHLLNMKLRPKIDWSMDSRNYVGVLKDGNSAEWNNVYLQSKLS